MSRQSLNPVAAEIQRRRLIDAAVDAGLIQPCPVCGTASITYPAAMLRCALQGTVLLDSTPTHLCVPPAPRPHNRFNPTASITDAVVDTWTGQS